MKRFLTSLIVTTLLSCAGRLRISAAKLLKVGSGYDVATP